MNTFNYRIIRKTDASGNFYLEVHEVYYNETKNIEGWTQIASTPFGSTKEELKEDIERMLTSLEAPLLEEFENTLREVEAFTIFHNSGVSKMKFKENDSVRAIVVDKALTGISAGVLPLGTEGTIYQVDTNRHYPETEYYVKFTTGACWYMIESWLEHV